MPVSSLSEATPLKTNIEVLGLFSLMYKIQFLNDPIFYDISGEKKWCTPPPKKKSGLFKKPTLLFLVSSPARLFCFPKEDTQTWDTRQQGEPKPCVFGIS